MLKVVLFVTLVTCLASICRAGTVKRKRQADGMVNDYLMEYGEGSGDYSEYNSGDDLTLYFFITYDKTFDEELLVYDSEAFRTEAKRIINMLITQIARNIGLIPEDIQVEVMSFSSGSTRAEITVKIPGYYDISEEELSIAVTDVAQFNKIDGAEIEKIEEIKLEDEMEAAVPDVVIIDLELTYEHDSSSLDLGDSESDAFHDEALIVQQQLLLHVIEKLAFQGILIIPDQLLIEVRSFKSKGPETHVILTFEAAGVTIDELSEALSYLVEGSDTDIAGRRIVAVVELSRSFSYDYGSDEDNDMSMKTEVMTDKDGVEDYFSGIETIPSDDPIVEGEVMLPKDEDNINGGGGLNGDNDHFLPESLTPDYEGSDGDLVIPDLESVPPEENEPLPPDVNEQTPPEDNEPTPPPEEDDQCTEISAPENGEMDCMLGNNLGSTCHFMCGDDMRLEGSSSVICGGDGYWSSDVPYCVRIYCQPHLFDIPNGMVGCTSHNLYLSVCTFSCNEKHSLIGASFVQCQKNETWSDKIPECIPDPINCEDEYGPWLQCEMGKRIKESVMVSTSAESIVCPEMVEDCSDCQLEWGSWGQCEEGFRSRSQFVAAEKVGVGEECTEPKSENEMCKDCLIEWGDWSECTDNKRTRLEFVKVYPVGGSECPPTESETEDCIDCVWSWVDWSECVVGKSTRERIVLQEPVGGELCGDLTPETEDCGNCELEWSDWSECVDGNRSINQRVLKEGFGKGKLCGDLIKDVESCQNCESKWSDWSECFDSSKSRTLEIIKEALGGGTDCPISKTEEEPCSNCIMVWEDWGHCIGGSRERSEFVHEYPKNGGTACDSPLFESIECAECELTWGDWGKCEGGLRSRLQYVSQEPFGVDDACARLSEEIDQCSDCVSSWGAWSECLNGLQERQLIIETEPSGGGAACPEETQDMKECCFFEWGDWGECMYGQRARTEQIVVQPRGEVCATPKVESEECRDCVVLWSEWDEVCIDNKISRRQEISEYPVGVGVPCPFLLTEEEDCANCEIRWSGWGECINSFRERLPEISVEPLGVGEQCPDLNPEYQDCANCVVKWSEWSECSNGERTISQYVDVEPTGSGEPCPELEINVEECLDCIVEWEEWSECADGRRTRSQYVKQPPVGVGKECPQLDNNMEPCIDCLLEWEGWSECADNTRSRSQFIAVYPEGAGEKCPATETRIEACIDCIVEWGAWSDCFHDEKTRRQTIIVELVGAGAECPPLDEETEECIVPGSKKALEKTICRFTDKVLGYKRNPVMRDLLLIGDESGSIGWVNFAKIKENFKAIAKNIRGGIGSQETQLAMSTFARFSRKMFDFDDFHQIEDLVAAIDKTYFRGGYRSKIGDALSDANTWLFQQTGGMRSFPGIEDNIIHEILIATDGCRTSDLYMLKKGLKVIKKRGIKLYVLGIESKDLRCQETVKSMVEDEEDLFMLGSWKQLDEMTKRLEEKVCISERRGDAADEDDLTSDP